ncbi:hypothetical protein HUX88_21925 [Duganella sp. BJB1802]|uniref:hypothetical protein n=1 Tax=Duganella sp. BJB1802 TaxID=2744575 RepID=UPI0015945E74|nr:hypothetical protein [Duganella sp. BJB1802]NVD73178.1 hypothetical protein [Duganella sp. BJB1802]
MGRRPPRAATDGREHPAPCATASACNGFLPWVALGLAGADGWGRPLRYSVTPAYTEANIAPARAVADKRVSLRDGDGAPRALVGQGPCSLASPCSPAVILSTGRQGPGVDALGIAQAGDFAGRTDELANFHGDSDFILRSRSDDPRAAGGPYDDLVTWVPLQQLYLKLNAVGALR